MPNVTQKPLRTLGSLWLLAVLIAWPLGDFPLDDDWSYAEAVKHWVDTGEYWVSDWPAMTLFTQVMWGGIFAKVFGFSFYALRLSTLALAGLGILAFRQTMVRLGLPGFWQLTALLTLVFNPIYFELSLTFMTDVPFLSLMAMSLYAYLRAFETDQWQWWAGATLLCILSILLRQTALLLPVAMGTAAILAQPGRKRLGWALGSTAMVYLSLKGYIFWQEHSSTGLPGAFSTPGQFLGQITLDYVFQKIKSLSGLYLLYLGVMLLPLSIRSSLSLRNKPTTISAAVTAGFCLLAIRYAWDQELLGNTLNQWGLGTTPLPGDRSAVHWPALPRWMALPAKITGAAGVLILIGHGMPRLTGLLQQYWQNRRYAHRLSPAQTLRLGLLGFLAAYGFFLLVNTFHFDRYLLPVLLSGLLILKPAPSPARWSMIFSGLLLVLLAAFSIIGTHDYFAWNRARWMALHSAMSQGIPPTKIDGGVEFNGWYRTGPLGQNVPFAKNWWFVAEDDYTVSFGPYANYRVEKEFIYERYLPPCEDTIFLLRRPDWARVDTFFYPMEPGHWPDYVAFQRLRPSEKKGLPGESYDGTHAYAMKAGQSYGMTHHLFPVKPYDELQFSFWANSGTGLPRLVVSTPDAGAFHHALRLSPAQPDRNGWQAYQATMRLPPSFPSDTVHCYFWKQSHNRILLDDFQIIWKQTKSR